MNGLAVDDRTPQFKYSIMLESLKPGTFALSATAIPFLAPVKAEVFEDAPGGPK